MRETERRSKVRGGREGKERTGNDRRVRMPTGVADTRLPRASTTSTHLVRASVEVRVAGARVARCLIDVDFAGQGGVEVVDVDAAVSAARVDISRVGAAGRGEVAADERLQHAVAAERDERAVVRMGAVGFVSVGHEAVVETGGEPVGVDTIKFLRRHHLS